MFDDQAQHISYIIDEVIARGGRTVEPTPEGQQGWCDMLAGGGSGGGSGGFLRECTPGYYNNEGASRGGGNTFLGAYTGGVNAFAELLADWRATGRLEGLEILATPIS
jgi:cyclohexanone monooxygenase